MDVPAEVQVAVAPVAAAQAVAALAQTDAQESFEVVKNVQPFTSAWQN